MSLEAELSVAIDVMLPTPLLTHAVAEFSLRFPDVPLRLYVEALGAVLQPVLDGNCAFGIVGTLPDVPGSVVRERLMEVQMVPVVSPSHPLGRHRGPLTINELSWHVQLVLTDRTSLSKGTEFGVVSARPWRLADLGAKHAFLKAGMGWGGMPLDLVQADIDSGTLVILDVVEMPKKGVWLTLSAAFQADAPPGPAGRWLIAQIKAEAERGWPNVIPVERCSWHFSVQQLSNVNTANALGVTVLAARRAEELILTSVLATIVSPSAADSSFGHRMSASRQQPSFSEGRLW